jgi:hypothetical protein
MLNALAGCTFHKDGAFNHVLDRMFVISYVRLNAYSMPAMSGTASAS